MDFFAIINAVLQLSNCNQNAKINHNYEPRIERVQACTCTR